MELVYLWWRRPSASMHQRGPVPIEVDIWEPVPTSTFLPSRWTFGCQYMELAIPDIYGKTNQEASSASEVPLRSLPAAVQDCIWYLVPTSSTGVPQNRWPRSKSFYYLSCVYSCWICWIGFWGSAPRLIEAGSAFPERLEWRSFWNCLYVILPIYFFSSLFRGTGLIDLFIAEFPPYGLPSIFYCFPCYFRLVVLYVLVIFDDNYYCYIY